MSALAMGWTLVLLGAVSFFLWMFLAVAPLETLADSRGLSGAGDLVGQAYRFAADWRHGMAGNSPLYMPGFFILAVATWFWSGSHARRVSRLVAEGGAVIVTGLAVAWTCAGVAETGIVSAFERSSGLTVLAAWPDPSLRAVAQGVYTAIAWMASMAACRRALQHRAFAPLLIIPPVTVVLAYVRPWTVDDFAALWIARVQTGSVAAIGSLAAIPLVVILLIGVTRRRHRVQNHRSGRRIPWEA